MIRPEVSSFVWVRETVPYDWPGCGREDPHWAAGLVGEVVRHSRDADVVRVKFDRGLYRIDREVNGCVWFHPDELEPVEEEVALQIGLEHCFKQWEGRP